MSPLPESETSTSDTTRRISYPAVEIAFIDRSADSFEESVPPIKSQFFSGYAPENILLRNPWRFVNGRIVDCQHHFHAIGPCSAESFLHPHVGAVGIPKVVEPRPLVITQRTDNKRAPVPFPDVISVPGRLQGIHVFGKTSSIRPDFAYRAGPREELQQFVGRLNELDRLRFKIQPWNTDRKSTRLNSSHIPLSRMPSSA